MSLSEHERRQLAAIEAALSQADRGLERRLSTPSPRRRWLLPSRSAALDPARRPHPGAPELWSGDNVRGAVVVGCDGRPASDAALRFASREATRRSAPLILMAAVFPQVDPDLDDSDTPESELLARASDLAERSLSRALSLPLDRLPPHRTITMSGLAWRVLLKGYPDAGLIVVGTHRRSPLARLFSLPSTSQNLIRRSRTPVVVVPPDDPPTRSRPNLRLPGARGQD